MNAAIRRDPRSCLQLHSCAGVGRSTPSPTMTTPSGGVIGHARISGGRECFRIPDFHQSAAGARAFGIDQAPERFSATRWPIAIREHDFRTEHFRRSAGVLARRDGNTVTRERQSPRVHHWRRAPAMRLPGRRMFPSHTVALSAGEDARAPSEVLRSVIQRQPASVPSAGVQVGGPSGFPLLSTACVHAAPFTQFPPTSPQV